MHTGPGARPLRRQADKRDSLQIFTLAAEIPGAARVLKQGLGQRPAGPAQERAEGPSQGWRGPGLRRASRRAAEGERGPTGQNLDGQFGTSQKPSGLRDRSEASPSRAPDSGPQNREGGVRGGQTHANGRPGSSQLAGRLQRARGRQPRCDNKGPTWRRCGGIGVERFGSDVAIFVGLGEASQLRCWHAESS